MKKWILLAVVLLAGCGGGSSSTGPEIVVSEPQTGGYLCHQSGPNPRGLPECPEVCWTGEGTNVENAPRCPE